jgi:poly-gamma-glutamate synthesis protein (capsule biosynthesis protein)
LLADAPALAEDHDSGSDNNPFLAGARDLAVVRAALERERPYAAPALVVTGVTVPHHMLAADLIARGVLAAAAGSYDRILLLSPDHFRSLKTPFGITTADLETVNGVLVADRLLAQNVLDASSMFSDIGSAPVEHGIHSVTPFIRAVFPAAQIVAVTTATYSTPEEWRAAAGVLGGLIGPKTLIVQSTDYSHFLPVEIAALRDQETLAALASGDPDAVLALNQPSHMDSRASQFIQMTLQRRLYNAAPVIIANRNAHEYMPGPGGTTSYVVTVFTPEPERGGRLRYPDQTVMYFGGDTYIGRGWTQPAMQASTTDWLARQITDVTAGHPFVVNLEGVVLEEQPAGANNVQHLMLARLTLPLLKKLGVTAASLANNHAYDFGEEGLAQSARLLEEGGIRALRHGTVTELGSMSVLPLTFKRSYFFDHAVIRSVSQLKSICDLRAASPLIVLAHWGADYTAAHGPFENEALNTLANCGVSAVIGSHSHQASKTVELRSGGTLQSVFSVGNLVFDQTGADVSGSLVEMRVFRQGTIALRIIPIPNFFAMLKNPGHTKGHD